MPGDVNVYALGIEFQLNAEPAIKMLKGIEEQAIKVQDILSKGIVIKTETGMAAKINDDIGKTSVKAAKATETYGSELENLKNILKEVEFGGQRGDLENVTRAYNNAYQALLDLNTIDPSAISKYGEKLEEQGARVAQFSQRLENVEFDQFNKGLDDALGLMGGKKIGGAFKWLKDTSGLVAQLFGKKLPWSAGAASKSLGGLSGNLGGAAKSTQGVIKGTAAVGPALQGAAGAAGGAAGAMAGVGTAMSAALGPIGLVIAIAQKLQEAFQALVGALGDLVPEEAKTTKAFFEAAKSGNILEATMSILGVAYKEFMDTQDEFRTVTYRSLGSMKDAVDASQNLRAELRLDREESVRTTKAIAESGLAFLTTGEELKNAATVTAKFNLTTGIAEKTTADFVRVNVAMGRGVAGATRALNTMIGGMKRLGISGSEAEGVMSELTDKAVELKALYGEEAFESYASGLMTLTEQFKKFGGGLKDAKKMMEDTADPFNKINILSGAFGKTFGSIQEKMAYNAVAAVKATEGWKGLNTEQKKLMADVRGMTVEQLEMYHAMKTAEGGVEGLEKALNKQFNAEKEGADLMKDFEESTASLKRQFIMLLNPIMAMLTKGMEPLGKLLKSVMDIAKPFINIISSVIDTIMKTGIVEDIALGAGVALAGLFGIIAAGVVASMSILAPFIEMFWAMGVVLKWVWGVVGPIIMDIWNGFVSAGKSIMKVFSDLFLIFKIVMSPLYVLFILPLQLAFKIIKWLILSIWDFHKAVFGGIIEAFEEMWGVVGDVIEPLKQAWNEFVALFAFSGGESFTWWKDVLGVIKIVAKYITLGLFLPLKGSLVILRWGIEYLTDALNAIIGPIKTIKKWLFGSGIFGIDKGIAMVMGPIQWLINMFTSFFGIVRKIADYASKPFTAIKDGVKAAATGVLGIVEKIPLIGRAATWVKGKLKGSVGLFGMGTLAEQSKPGLSNTLTMFNNIGKTAGAQKSIIGSLFSSILSPLDTINEFGRSSGLMSFLQNITGIKPIEKVDEIAGGEKPKLAAPITTIRDAREMGRPPEGVKELKNMSGQFNMLADVINKAAGMLNNSEGAKKVLAILEEYMPKIAERPSDLGPAISTW